MKRLATAPNVLIATLWADQLRAAGFAATVQRYYAGSIAGDIPPDQALPEVWIQDDAQWAAAQAWLQALQRPAEGRWGCHGCGEIIDAPFEQCWQCGALRPAPP